MVKCKSKLCDLERGHKGKCYRVVNRPVVNASVVNSAVVNLGAYTPGCGVPVATAADMGKSTVTTSTRQVQWQQANRDRYNEKMRAVMKRRRAKG